jgi:hypothetical protein
MSQVVGTMMGTIQKTQRVQGVGGGRVKGAPDFCADLMYLPALLAPNIFPRPREVVSGKSMPTQATSLGHSCICAQWAASLNVSVWWWGLYDQLLPNREPNFKLLKPATPLRLTLQLQLDRSH